MNDPADYTREELERAGVYFNSLSPSVQNSIINANAGNLSAAQAQVAGNMRRLQQDAGGPEVTPFTEAPEWINNPNLIAPTERMSTVLGERPLAATTRRLAARGAKQVSTIDQLHAYAAEAGWTRNEVNAWAAERNLDTHPDRALAAFKREVTPGWEEYKTGMAAANREALSAGQQPKGMTLSLTQWTSATEARRLMARTAEPIGRSGRVDEGFFQVNPRSPLQVPENAILASAQTLGGQGKRFSMATGIHDWFKFDALPVADSGIKRGPAASKSDQGQIFNSAFIIGLDEAGKLGGEFGASGYGLHGIQGKFGSRVSRTIYSPREIAEAEYKERIGGKPWGLNQEASFAEGIHGPRSKNWQYQLADVVPLGKQEGGKRSGQYGYRAVYNQFLPAEAASVKFGEGPVKTQAQYSAGLQNWGVEGSNAPLQFAGTLKQPAGAALSFFEAEWTQADAARREQIIGELGLDKAKYETIANRGGLRELYPFIVERFKQNIGNYTKMVTTAPFAVHQSNLDYYKATEVPGSRQPIEGDPERSMIQARMPALVGPAMLRTSLTYNWGRGRIPYEQAELLRQDMPNTWGRAYRQSKQQRQPYRNLFQAAWATEYGVEPTQEYLPPSKKRWGQATSPLITQSQTPLPVEDPAVKAVFGQALRSAVQTLNPTGEGEVDEGRLAYEFTRNLRGAKVEEDVSYSNIPTQVIDQKVDEKREFTSLDELQKRSLGLYNQRHDLMKQNKFDEAQKINPEIERLWDMERNWKNEVQNQVSESPLDKKSNIVRVTRNISSKFLSAKDAEGNVKVLPPMQDWHRWTAQGDEAGSDMSVFGSRALEMARGVLSDEPYQEALMGSDYQKGEQTLHRKGLAELVAQTGLTKRTMQMASSLFPTQSKGVVAGFNPALAPGQTYQPGVDEGKLALMNRAPMGGDMAQQLYRTVSSEQIQKWGGNPNFNAMSLQALTAMGGDVDGDTLLAAVQSGDWKLIDGNRAQNRHSGQIIQTDQNVLALAQRRVLMGGKGRSDEGIRNIDKTAASAAVVAAMPGASTAAEDAAAKMAWNTQRGQTGLGYVAGQQLIAASGLFGNKGQQRAANDIFDTIYGHVQIPEKVPAGLEPVARGMFGWFTKGKGGHSPSLAYMGEQGYHQMGSQYTGFQGILEETVSKAGLLLGEHRKNATQFSPEQFAAAYMTPESMTTANIGALGQWQSQYQALGKQAGHARGQKLADIQGQQSTLRAQLAENVLAWSAPGQGKRAGAESWLRNSLVGGALTRAAVARSQKMLAAGKKNVSLGGFEDLVSEGQQTVNLEAAKRLRSKEDVFAAAQAGNNFMGVNLPVQPTPSVEDVAQAMAEQRPIPGGMPVYQANQSAIDARVPAIRAAAVATRIASDPKARATSWLAEQSVNPADYDIDAATAEGQFALAGRYAMRMTGQETQEERTERAQANRRLPAEVQSARGKSIYDTHKRPNFIEDFSNGVASQVNLGAQLPPLPAGAGGGDEGGGPPVAIGAPGMFGETDPIKSLRKQLGQVQARQTLGGQGGGFGGFGGGAKWLGEADIQKTRDVGSRIGEYGDAILKATEATKGYTTHQTAFVKTLQTFKNTVDKLWNDADQMSQRAQDFESMGDYSRAKQWGDRAAEAKAAVRDVRMMPTYQKLEDTILPAAARQQFEGQLAAAGGEGGQRGRGVRALGGNIFDELTLGGTAFRMRMTWGLLTGKQNQMQNEFFQGQAPTQEAALLLGSQPSAAGAAGTWLTAQAQQAQARYNIGRGVSQVTTPLAQMVGGAQMGIGVGSAAAIGGYGLGAGLMAGYAANTILPMFGAGAAAAGPIGLGVGAAVTAGLGLGYLNSEGKNWYQYEPGAAGRPTDAMAQYSYDWRKTVRQTQLTRQEAQTNGNLIFGNRSPQGLALSILKPPSPEVQAQLAKEQAQWQPGNLPYDITALENYTTQNYPGLQPGMGSSLLAQVGQLGGINETDLLAGKSPQALQLAKSWSTYVQAGANPNDIVQSATKTAAMAGTPYGSQMIAWQNQWQAMPRAQQLLNEQAMETGQGLFAMRGTGPTFKTKDLGIGDLGIAGAKPVTYSPELDYIKGLANLPGSSTIKAQNMVVSAERIAIQIGAKNYQDIVNQANQQYGAAAMTPEMASRTQQLMTGVGGIAQAFGRYAGQAGNAAFEQQFIPMAPEKQQGVAAIGQQISSTVMRYGGNAAQMATQYQEEGLNQQQIQNRLTQTYGLAGGAFLPKSPVAMAMTQRMTALSQRFGLGESGAEQVGQGIQSMFGSALGYMTGGQQLAATGPGGNLAQLYEQFQTGQITQQQAAFRSLAPLGRTGLEGLGGQVAGTPGGIAFAQSLDPTKTAGISSYGSQLSSFMGQYGAAPTSQQLNAFSGGFGQNTAWTAGAFQMGGQGQAGYAWRQMNNAGNQMNAFGGQGWQYGGMEYSPTAGLQQYGYAAAFARQERSGRMQHANAITSAVGSQELTLASHEMTLALRDNTKAMTDENRRYAVEQAGFSMQRAAMSYRQGMESIGLQEKEAQTRARQQREEFGITGERQSIQAGWQRQDFTYQTNMAGLQFGWQQEDLSRNIRFATGRQRQDLLRQQQRSQVTYGMETAQRGRERERMETGIGWQGDDLGRAKKNFEEMQSLAAEGFAMQRRHLQENFALQMAQIAAQLAHEQKMWGLEDEQRKLQNDYQDKQMKFEEEQAKRQVEMAKLAASDFEAEIERQKVLDAAAKAYYDELTKAYQEGGKAYDSFQAFLTKLQEWINSITFPKTSGNGNGGYSKPPDPAAGDETLPPDDPGYNPDDWPTYDDNGNPISPKNGPKATAAQLSQPYVNATGSRSTNNITIFLGDQDITDLVTTRVTSSSKFERALDGMARRQRNAFLN